MPVFSKAEASIIPMESSRLKLSSILQFAKALDPIEETYLRVAEVTLE